MKRGLLAAALLSFASASQAGIIQLDPSQFASGTDISHAFDGVTLSNIYVDLSQGPYAPGERPELVYDPVYSVASTSGQLVFGSTFPGVGAGLTPIWVNSNRTVTYFSDDTFLPQWVNLSWNALHVQFDASTNYVELTGASGSGMGSNPVLLAAFDSNGELIQQCWAYSDAQNNAPGCNYVLGPTNASPITVSFTSGDRDIAFVTAGGFGGGRILTSLSYDSESVASAVPEPTVLALFAAAGVPLLWRRRRSSPQR